jgi:hypothetical protein
MSTLTGQEHVRHVAERHARSTGAGREDEYRPIGRVTDYMKETTRPALDV